MRRLILFIIVILMGCGEIVTIPEVFEEDKDMREDTLSNYSSAAEEEIIHLDPYNQDDYDSLFFPLGCEKIGSSDYYFATFGVGVTAIHKICQDLDVPCPAPYIEGGAPWEWNLLPVIRPLYDSHLDPDSNYWSFRTGVLEAGETYRIRVGHRCLGPYQDVQTIPDYYLEDNKYADSDIGLFVFKVGYDGRIIPKTGDPGKKSDSLVLPKGEYGDSSDTGWFVRWSFIGDSMMDVYFNMRYFFPDSSGFNTDIVKYAHGIIGDLSKEVVMAGDLLSSPPFVEDDTSKAGLSVFDGYAGEIGIWRIPRRDSLKLFFYGIWPYVIDFSGSDYGLPDGKFLARIGG